MLQTITVWQVGQKAIIDRTRRVSVERVTPTGRVVADGRTFEPDGYERGKASAWGLRSRLELLTPEMQAEIDLVSRGRAATNAALAANEAADKWLRGSFGWGNRTYKAADVEKAEKLAAAIRQVLEAD